MPGAMAPASPYASRSGGDVPTGKALLSWRVALLPFLEENELYKQFHLDEAWDSDHNKKLLAKMPRVFAPPGFRPPRSIAIGRSGLEPARDFSGWRICSVDWGSF